MTSSKDSASSEDSPSVGRLSRAQFWGILAMVLLVFVFSEGAVWWHPWDMALLNGAIWYSYFPIPLLVAVGLAVNKTLGLRGWFLDVLSLTFLKYGITFSFALVLWAVAPVPVHEVASPRAAEASTASPENLPAPTPIPAEKQASMTGAVIDRATRTPVEGALVFIEDGLRDYVFAPPNEPVRLENEGRGIAPLVSAAALNQVIEARSTDGRLHTLVATRGGDVLFNLPLIRSGVWNHAVVRDAPGETALRCTVHQGAQAEPEARMHLLAHPFFATTGPDGRFRFEGLPPGRLTLTAETAERRSSTAVELEPGEAESIELVLGD